MDARRPSARYVSGTYGASFGGRYRAGQVVVVGAGRDPAVRWDGSVAEMGGVLSLDGVVEYRYSSLQAAGRWTETPDFLPLGCLTQGWYTGIPSGGVRRPTLPPAL